MKSILYIEPEMDDCMYLISRVKDLYKIRYGRLPQNLSGNYDIQPYLSMIQPRRGQKMKFLGTTLNFHLIR